MTDTDSSRTVVLSVRSAVGDPVPLEIDGQRGVPLATRHADGHRPTS